MNGMDILKIDEWIWRLIISYYLQSKIIVKIKNKRSEVFETSQGVKQGGKLSGFLFNFFINELIEQCLELNIGAKIGQTNVSIVAYCDDILLISPTFFHLNILTNVCNEYAQKWKMEFNPLKSNLISFGQDCSENNVKMNDKIIPRSNNMVYLGFPIGDSDFINQFIEKKSKKVERSFYSLYTLGCKPNGLSPKTISFIYKQFCQSIFRYVLEFYYLNNKMIDSLNIRQNILIKRSIGLSKYVRTKPLFKCLRIESIESLYLKHKIFLFKQVKMNLFTHQIYKELKIIYSQKVLRSDNATLFEQLKNVNKKINVSDCTIDVVKAIKMIESLTECLYQGLIDSINFVLNDSINGLMYDKIRVLAGLLNNGFTYLHN